MKTTINLFAIIGALTCLCIIIVALIFVIQVFVEFGEKKKYEHIKKNRFNKQPTAKCFCKDCKHWRQSDGRCFYFENRCTADCWFCWNAEPLTHKEYAKRKNND